MKFENKSKSSFTVWLTTTDGKKVLVGTQPAEILSDNRYDNDLVTDDGLALRAGLLGGVGAVTALTAIAVGTGTTAPAATDTILTTEVDRAASTNSLITTTTANDTLEMTVTIAFTAAATITEVGTFTSTTASTGTMYTHDLLPGTGVSVASGDSLSFVFQFQQTS